MSLIADLFPGIQLDSASYAELQVAIGNQVEAAGLINHPPWNLKLVQVYYSMYLGNIGVVKSFVNLDGKHPICRISLDFFLTSQTDGGIKEADSFTIAQHLV